MTSASPVFLVDTNVLIYAYDAAELQKRERAIEVLRLLLASNGGAISTQILGEFYSSITRKPRFPLTKLEAEEAVVDYIRTFAVFDVTTPAVLEAVRAAREYQLSYYDAVLWATAKLHAIPNLLTEDMQDTQLIEGVRIMNPFEPSFDLAILR